MAKKKIIDEDNLVKMPLASLVTRPEKVAIVALGSSHTDFTREMISRATSQQKPPWDEIWTCNRGILAIPHHKAFVMDDLKWIEREKGAYADHLKNHDKPIFTSTVYDDYPMAIEYPLQEVMETIQDDIFCVNTISYMVAYAMHIGSVKEISLFGCDFFYPDGNKSEEGGQAVAYLLGMATGKGMVVGDGMKHKIPSSSTLLYAHKVKVDNVGRVYRPPYGFHRKEKKNAA